MKPTDYRYQFETKKTKGVCPNCKHNEFRFMYDTTTGYRLPQTFGRCERLNNCGYIQLPTKENYPDHFLNSKQGNRSFQTKYKISKPMKSEISEPKTPILYVDNKLVEVTMNRENCNFKNYLYSIFDNDDCNLALSMYHVGTSKTLGTIFWYCDLNGNFRTGKEIAFPQTLYPEIIHRIKKQTPYYIHTKLPQTSGDYKVCLFGEHLLTKYPDKNVAIVESEKSAIICSIAHPEYIWIACGGANGLTKDKMEILKDRKIILYNDYDSAGRDTFQKKADEYKRIGYSLTIADYYPDINDKSDYCDRILEFAIDSKQHSIPQQSKIDNIDLQIIEHYNGYELPYDYTKESELISITNGFNFKYSTNISIETYLKVLISNNVPTRVLPTMLTVFTESDSEPPF